MSSDSGRAGLRFNNSGRAVLRTTSNSCAIMEEPIQLPEGTLSVFELSLDASSDIGGLMDAVRSMSSSVEEVRVDIYNSFTSRWDEDGVSSLFHILGEVPQLLKIEFYGLRIFPYQMPISLAERTLSQAANLQEFSLVGVNLTATNPIEFQHFTETLQHHPSLRVFGLDNCRLRDERAGPTLDEAIVKPLVEIPSLERVVIRAMEVSMWSTLSCSSVELLCSSTTLKSLELSVFSNSGSSFLKEMAQSLMLHHDTSRLVDVSMSGTLGGEKGAQIIAEMIQTNTRLKSLELHVRERCEEDEAGIIGLSTALAKNKTLEKFQLHGQTDKEGSLEARQAYLDMLRTNYTLQHSLEVFRPGFLRPENDLYLKLNRVGRGRLMENCNVHKSEWVDTLNMVNNDIDCLFYLLKRNPLLCSTSAETEAENWKCRKPDSPEVDGEEEKRKRRRLDDISTPELVAT